MTYTLAIYVLLYTGFFQIYNFREVPPPSQHFTISFTENGQSYYLNGRLADNKYDVTIITDASKKGTRWTCTPERLDNCRTIFRIGNRSAFLNGKTCSEDGEVTLKASKEFSGTKWEAHRISYNQYKLECLSVCAKRWLTVVNSKLILSSNEEEAKNFTITNDVFSFEKEKFLSKECQTKRQLTETFDCNVIEDGLTNRQILINSFKDEAEKFCRQSCKNVDWNRTTYSIDERCEGACCRIVGNIFCDCQ